MKWPFWLFVVVPMAVLVLFTGGMLTPLFMASGIVFAVFSWKKYRGQVHPLALVIGVPLAVAAVFAPSRALYLFLVSVNEVKWGDDIIRDLSLPGTWFEYLVGLSGAWFGINVLLSDGFWRLRQFRQVDVLPTSTVLGAAQGLVEIKGKTVQPSLWLAMFPTLFRQLHGKRPFVIQDETGWAVVDPRHAEVRPMLPIPFLFGRRVNEIVLTRHEGMLLDWKSEPAGGARWLEDGDEVYVIGHLQAKPAKLFRSIPGVPSDLDPAAEIPVIGPSQAHGKGDNLLRIFFGKFFRYKGHDSQDVFFLADTTESNAKRYIRQGLTATVVWSLVWVACSLALALFLRPHPDVFNFPEQNPYNPSFTSLRTQLLESELRETRLQAAEILRWYSSRDEHRIRLFHDALKQEVDPNIRIVLARGLGRIAELNYQRRRPLDKAWSWEVVTALQIAATDNVEAQRTLVYALGYMPMVSLQTLPLLSDYVRNGDEQTRRNAFRSLDYLAKDSEPAKRVLQGIAENPTDPSQFEAMNVLRGRLSPDELRARPTGTHRSARKRAGNDS